MERTKLLTITYHIMLYAFLLMTLIPIYIQEMIRDSYSAIYLTITDPTLLLGVSWQVSDDL